jgi:hypothetical protein
MYSWHRKNSITACVATVLILLLGACASSAQKQPLGEEQAVRTIRCPSGYTMVCEAKKVGRIRFGTIGKQNMESCACEPENFASGRTQQPALPQ